MHHWLIPEGGSWRRDRLCSGLLLKRKVDASAVLPESSMPSTILGQGVVGIVSPKGEGRTETEQAWMLGSWGGAAIGEDEGCKLWQVRKGRVHMGAETGRNTGWDAGD